MTVSAPPRRAAVGHRAALAVICAAPLLVIASFSTPLFLVPQTAAHLGSGPVGQIWIINAVSLGLAAFVLTSGSLADNLGRRRAFAAGAWVFALSSLAAALAPDTLVFAVARAVGGAASAVLLTAGLGILGDLFTGWEERRHATARYGAMLGVGVAMSTVVSLAANALLGWNGAYWLYAAVVAALAVAARAYLPESRAQRPRRIDIPGTVALGLGLTALMSGLALGRRDWSDPQVIGLLAAGAVLIAAFAGIEARSREPMLELGLFRRPRFLVASLGALVAGAAVITVNSYLPTVFQYVLGMGAAETGALVGIWSVTAYFAANAAKRLRLSSHALLALGLTAAAAGSAMLVGAVEHWSWWQVVLALVVGGIGYGTVNPALTRLAIDSVPADRGGLGAGVNNTMRYVGTGIGMPAVVALVDGAGFDEALLVCAGAAVLSAAVFLALGRADRQTPR